MESLTRRRLRASTRAGETAGRRHVAGSSAARWHTATLLGMVGVASLVFGWALLALHRAHHSNAFDLGFFDQIVWNTSRGRPFETSFTEYNFLGQHVEPVLLLYAAAYRIVPRVELLLVTQAAVAAAAAVPLFFAARRALTSGVAALLVAATYLLSPHVHGAVLFDFHPEVMAAAGIFGAFALMMAGMPGWSVAALASVFLLKEDAALAAIGFALLLWMRGHWRWAVVLAAGSLLYLLVVVGVVMPAVRGGPGDLQDRYGYLGDDTVAIAVGALRHPGVVLAHLFGPAQTRGLIALLATLALLPLAGLGALAAAPLLAASMLSTHPAQHNLTLHYPIMAYDLLLVAATLGAASLSCSQRVRSVARAVHLPDLLTTIALAALMLFCTLIGWVWGSPLGPRRFDAERFTHTEHDAAVDRVLARVPADAPLSAQSGLVPHVSQRRAIWEFPRLQDAEFVVVDPSSWHSSQATDAGYDRIRANLPSLGYCLVHEEDRVQLYRKGAACASR